MDSSFQDIVPPNSLFPLFAKGRDPQLILQDLDKGLRSQKINEQYESLLFFAKLINEYPQAVVVNTAFMKLSDLFRVSNNFIRYYILQVFIQCQQHTNKILNIDEVLKRLYSVLLSNDPDARAITLRVFATMPTIIADRINIHHGIRNCMDTHHQVEVDATLHVMDKLCAVSPVFANGVLPKIASLIDSLSTSPKRKVHLIRIMRHMHHTTDMAGTARQHLENLLANTLNQSLKHALLHTLTYLAVKTHIHLSSHVSLLLTHISDPRHAIQLIALKDLRWLGRISPHGTDYGISQLLELAKSSPYDDIKIHALDVVRVLSETIYTQILGVEGLEICKEYLFYPNAQIVDISTQILTSLFTNTSPAEDPSPATPATPSHILSDLANLLCGVITSRFGTPRPESGAKKPAGGTFSKNSNIFHCIARLVKHRPAYAQLFTDSFVSILPRVTAEEAYMLIHNMTMYIPYKRDAIHPHARALHQFAQQAKDPKIIIGIVILLERGYTHSIDLHPSLLTNHLLPLSTLSHRSLPHAYTLATHSLAHGYPSVASPLFQFLLDTGIESDPVFCWMSALAAVACAEARRPKKTSRFGHLPAALSSLYTCKTHLAAAHATLSCQSTAFFSTIPVFSTTHQASFASPAQRSARNIPNFKFQTAFIDLRIAFLKAVLALNSTLLTVPKIDVDVPASNNPVASSANVEMMDMSEGYDEEIVEEGSGSVAGIGISLPVAPLKIDAKSSKPKKKSLDFTAQAHKHSHVFRDLAHRYSSLCAQFPKMDAHSVSVLESYELMCSLIAYATDAVLAKTGPTTTPTLVLRLLEAHSSSARDPIYSSCMLILSQLHEIAVQDIYLDGEYLSELLFNVMSVPAVYPKFFLHPST
eukprot:Phypoly_transcript_02627.p1 GENE.Phypoly_transcript_02627~~Phypoly_transcript_02627.p1  ORF type:complete len:873 (+),score=161.32 Phypoly_transcript_02627:97-2715(+)